MQPTGLPSNAPGRKLNAKALRGRRLLIVGGVGALAVLLLVMRGSSGSADEAPAAYDTSTMSTDPLSGGYSVADNGGASADYYNALTDAFGSLQTQQDSMGEQINSLIDAWNSGTLGLGTTGTGSPTGSTSTNPQYAKLVNAVNAGDQTAINFASGLATGDANATRFARVVQQHIDSGRAPAPTATAAAAGPTAAEQAYNAQLAAFYAKVAANDPATMAFVAAHGG